MARTYECVPTHVHGMVWKFVFLGGGGGIYSN
jgi:hypothetical protein